MASINVAIKEQFVIILQKINKKQTLNKDRPCNGPEKYRYS
jgi:hypothetical protein